MSLLAGVERAAAQVVTVTPSNIWKMEITIGRTAAWVEGSKQMTVSPRMIGAKFYVPRNLSLSLGQLDAMLPYSFTSYMKAHASAEKCLVDTSENADLLHGLLIDMLAEEWFYTGSPLRADIRTKFAIPTRERERDAADVEQLEAAWLLCTFYNWKRSGLPPAWSELGAALRTHRDRIVGR